MFVGLVSEKSAAIDFRKITPDFNAGKNTSTNAPTIKANPASTAGLDNCIHAEGPGESPGARNVSFMLAPGKASLEDGVIGNSAKMGAASIFRVRQMLAASARTNTASGSRSKRFVVNSRGKKVVADSPRLNFPVPTLIAISQQVATLTSF